MREGGRKEGRERDGEGEGGREDMMPDDVPVLQHQLSGEDRDNVMDDER